MSHLISPSLLAADFGNLKRDIELINESDADWFHLDVMDGVFVPNLSFGIPVIEHIAKIATKPLDVHFMIVEPDKFIPQMKDLGVYMYNVHIEACTHLHRVIQKIKGAGMKAAVTLNPSTPVSLLQDIIQELDMVLLMSVNPGFGGQAFIENTLKKTAELKELILKKGLNTLIEIDGGVNVETGKRLLDKGADVLVAGSYVFQSNDPKKIITDLKTL